MRARVASACSRVVKVDGVGQVVEERADDPDVLGPDQTLGLGGGGVGEFRGQWFPGQGAAGAEMSGILQTAVGVVPGDPQPFGDDGRDRGGTQLDGGGFGVQPGQQGLGDAGQGPGVGLHPTQHLEDVFVGQRVDRHRSQLVTGGVEPVEHGHHRVAIGGRTGTHTSNIRAAPQVLVGSCGCNPPRQR
jgi:hypothetical protein